jgi:hypothetical protein
MNDRIVPDVLVDRYIILRQGTIDKSRHGPNVHTRQLRYTIPPILSLRSFLEERN